MHAFMNQLCCFFYFYVAMFDEDWIETLPGICDLRLGGA